MTGHALRILLIEDNEDDAILLLSRFRRAGYELEWERVETEAGLIQALAGPAWDLVLSDYRLPGFSGLAALECIQAQGVDVPFFIISGTIDDETASAVMRAGAQDYLAKDRLDRLIPAVQRELREARIRRERVAAIEAARDHEARHAAIVANIPGMVFQLTRQADGQMHFDFVSEGVQLLFDVSPAEFLEDDMRFVSMIVAEDRIGFLDMLAQCSQRLATLNWEGRIRLPERDIKWINVRGSPQQLPDGATRWEGVIWNITLSKQAQAELSSSRAELAALSNHLQRVKEVERERIARDIHDVLGGLLVGIKIELSVLAGKLDADEALSNRARHIARMVDEAITTAGRVARELRPGILKEFGLAAAIESHAEDFGLRTGITCEVACADHDIHPPEDTAIAVFRVFQEALTNVSKHAQATFVVIRLTQEGDEIVLQVVDDGIGIRGVDFEKPKSFGLRGIRERAENLNGSVIIKPVAPSGTELVLRAPLSGAAAASPSSDPS